MILRNYRQVEGNEAAPGVIMRVVAGPAEGAPNFAMRIFEIRPGSSTPAHSHAWEHEVFVVSGRGAFRGGNTEELLADGDTVLVMPDEPHCFVNTGDELLVLICVVPLVNGTMPGTPSPD